MRPYRRQPTRLPHPWDSLGKNTGVGLPFPSSKHESKNWKWNRSVVSNPQRPHGLQPTRLLRPWDWFSRQEYWSGVPVPPPVRSNPGPYPSYTLWRTHAHSLQSRLPLCSVWTVAQQASVPMGFSRQEYWSRQPFYPPGDLPNLGIEPLSPVATALAGRIFFTIYQPRSSYTMVFIDCFFQISELDFL